jgi:hypothetical protein
MPAISVLKDGTLGVAFYDRRSSPGELDVFAARASFRHGFHATPNVRVTTGSSPVADIAYFRQGRSCFPSGRFFGDYIGVAADQATLDVVWADTQLHRLDETDIWFARVVLPDFSGERRIVIVHHPSGAFDTVAFGWRARLSGLHVFGLSGAQLLIVLAPILFLLALTMAMAVATLRESSVESGHA